MKGETAGSSQWSVRSSRIPEASHPESLCALRALAVAYAVQPVCLVSALDPYREMFELASEGIFVSDLDGRYFDVNQAACDLLGYRREDIVGKTVADI